MFRKQKRWSATSKVSTILQPTRVADNQNNIGRLPEAALLSILIHATIPDVRSLSLCCRRIRLLARDDRVWSVKLAYLNYKGVGKERTNKKVRQPSVNGPSSVRPPIKKRDSTNRPTKTAAQVDEFEFGEFVDVEQAASFSSIKPSDDLLMDLGDDAGEDIAARSSYQKPVLKQASKRNSKQPSIDATGKGGQQSSLDLFQTAYMILMPYYSSLQTHTISSLVFTNQSLSLLDRAHLLSTLAWLLTPALCPTRSNPALAVFRRNLISSIDYFEGSILTEFERADVQDDEQAMKRCADVAWELASPTSSNASAGHNLFQVFLNRREIFFDQSHNPMRNLVKIQSPDSSRTGEMVDGIDFAAMDRYMTHVLDFVAKDGLTIARVFPAKADLLLDYAERLAQDAMSEYITPLLSAAQNLPNPLFLLATAASFVQASRLVDGILAVEPKSPRITRHAVEDVVYRMFEAFMDDYLSEEGEWVKQALVTICKAWSEKLATDPEVGTALFLSAPNAAQAKRNVMSSFGKALMLPVVVVPRTVVYSLSAVTTGAFNAVIQIGSGIGGLASSASSHPKLIVDEVKELQHEAEDWNTRVSLDQQKRPAKAAAGDSYAKLQLLLSLDTALQLIQATRDCLKRIQTFSGYPGSFGRKVRDALEEAFIILLQTLGEMHISPAFKQAESHMSSWKPAEHGSETSVAPLVQFFELVHVGDTIGQMMQVFYDREMASFIDKTDFLNIVVREKKRFESLMDDSVAAGLNIGVQLLMDHVEHLMTIKQDPADFCPVENAEMNFEATTACSEVIECLQMHCSMLKGSTDKQILEVFYQEIGLRLHGLILKHLKRSMISSEGGLQVISDINAYHAFVVSLRQPSLMPYYTALKMVSSVYIVDSPKDMAALVKDVQRYEGTLRSEDAYELLQRRTDWRLKEKAVDKALYGLSTEDCIVS